MEPGIERHLRDNAVRYFPDLAEAEVRVHRTGGREGALSSIQCFSLSSGGIQHRVVVKRPPAAGGGQPASGRPRVAPLLDPLTKPRQELAALRALERHFEGRGDARFRAVRVLDFLEAEQALVMEESPGRPLARLAAGAIRLWQPLGGRTLPASFARIGAWLRAYHELPALAHTRPRIATRDEFVDSIRSLAEYLDAAHPAEHLPEGTPQRVERLCAAWLPHALPLATSHGDLAPRNVLVDPAGRVAVLDTRAAWSAPIYEDLAYFLTATRTPRAQAASLGLAFGPSSLRRLERAFLDGYFAGAPAPMERIRLFELQALLDKWASQTAARGTASGRGSGGRSYRDWSADRLFQRRIAEVLAELEGREGAR